MILIGLSVVVTFGWAIVTSIGCIVIDTVVIVGVICIAIVIIVIASANARLAPAALSVSVGSEAPPASSPAGRATLWVPGCSRLD